MNKMLAAAVAAVIAGTSLGAASAAEAQSRNDRFDRRETVQPRPTPRATPPRIAPTPPRAAPAQLARWQRAQRRYNAPRYVAPRGYQARNWSYGQQMPAAYRSRTYVVSDYGRYGLGQPPRGYQYVRSGNDVVMTAIATGFISAIIVGLFN